MASEDGSPATTQEKDVEDMPLVPVRIPHSLDTQGQAADYGGWITYHLAGTEQPQPILPFDSYRHRATIKADAPATGASGATELFYGNVPSPTAGQVIATSGTLPQGNYTVVVTAHPTGTLAAPADYDNLQLLVGATVVGTLIQQASAGNVNQSTAVTVPVPAGGAAISVEAIGAATAGAVYKLQLAITPQAATGYVYLGTQAQCLRGLAGILAIGQQVVVENNQQLWMAPDGSDPVVVTVLAERWDSGT
jgi:hypothetical protein